MVRYRNRFLQPIFCLHPSLPTTRIPKGDEHHLPPCPTTRARFTAAHPTARPALSPPCLPPWPPACHALAPLPRRATALAPQTRPLITMHPCDHRHQRVGPTSEAPCLPLTWPLARVRSSPGRWTPPVPGQEELLAAATCCTPLSLPLPPLSQSARALATTPPSTMDATTSVTM